jgi:hypothetical protein
MPAARTDDPQPSARRAPPRWLARWALAAAWLSLPFTIGPALAEALSPRSPLVQQVDSTGLWVVWAAGLVSTLVASTVTFTANRVLAVSALAAAVAAWIGGADTTAAVVGVAAGVVVVAIALNAVVADTFVNGSSYGDEQRFLLRTPAPLLLGPVELAVVLVIAGVAAGPMLLAAEQVVAGVVALVVGWPLAAVLLRSLHGLSRRWIVFVPVGLVVHDYTALIDSLLVPRAGVARVGWAPEGTDAVDLTANAAGRVVQLDFRQPESVLPRPGRRPGSDGPAVEPVSTSAVLVAPARPAALLEEAARRRLPVTGSSR